MLLRKTTHSFAFLSLQYSKMKTLRHLVKGKNIEEKSEKRSRKISLPVQRYPLELNESAKEPRKESLWSNVRRKISVSSPAEESSKIEQHQKSESRCYAYQPNCDFNYDISEAADIPRLRRVSSDVSEEDVLSFAIVEGDINLLRSTIDDAQVNVNYMRPPGTAPLHQACALGNLQIVELLIKGGANIHLRDYRDLSPLQIANLYGQFEIAEYLIRMGSPVVDIKDGFRVDKRKRKRSSCFSSGARQSAYEPTTYGNLKYN